MLKLILSKLGFAKISNKDLQELKETANRILSVDKMELIDLQNNKEILKQELKEVRKEVVVLKKQAKESELQIQTMSSNIEELEKLKVTKEQEILVLDETKEMESFNLYEPKHNLAKVYMYKERLDIIRNKQKELIKTSKAVSFLQDSNINRDSDISKFNIKRILSSFNADCDITINKVKFNNIDKIEKIIRKSFEDLNKLNESNGIYITQEYLSYKLQELYLAFEYQEKKQEEKEILKQEKENKEENKQIKIEIQKKKKIIEKELSHYENMCINLENRSKIVTVEAEKESIQKELQEMKIKAIQVKNDIDELNYIQDNTGAGYCCIISNIGAFGENIVKIGVTKKLNPEERVGQLSNASVPFKFDIHAMIFSSDAYALEKELHNKFKNYRVNLSNHRKEFFYISIDEIEEELRKYKNLVIEFNKVPEAKEYRETLKLKENIS